MNSVNDEIVYPERKRIIERMEEEVNRALGNGAWARIRQEAAVPEDGMDNSELSRAMRMMMDYIDAETTAATQKTAFCNVRHALTRSHLSWARNQFRQYGNIDAFCDAIRQQNREELVRALETNGDFYGQPVDRSVIEFFDSQPYLLYGARKGHQIHATAIPYRTIAYLQETDPRRKRYLACHCEFARESLLHADGPVSKTLCYCSLGHTKIFWETALDTELSGDVVESVLGGGLLCRFVIDLPQEIVERYTT